MEYTAGWNEDYDEKDAKVINRSYGFSQGTFNIGSAYNLLNTQRMQSMLRSRMSDFVEAKTCINAIIGTHMRMPTASTGSISD